MPFQSAIPTTKMAATNPGGRDYLTRLPTELLLEITKHSESDDDAEGHTEFLSALSQVSSKLNNVFEPMLYGFQANGPSALVWGAFHGRIDVMEKALSYGVDIDAEGQHSGVEKQLEKTFSVLKSWEIFRCAHNIGPGTALTTAILGGQEEATQWILGRNPDIDKGVKLRLEECPWLPLHLAIACGQTSTAKRLLRSGAKLNEVCSKRFFPLRQFTALECAVFYAKPDIVQHLMKEYGAGIASEEFKGLYCCPCCGGRAWIWIASELSVLAVVDVTPLEIACEDGNWELAHALIPNGADFSTPHSLATSVTFENSGRNFLSSPKWWERELRLRMPLVQLQVKLGHYDSSVLELAVDCQDYAYACPLLDSGLPPTLSALSSLAANPDDHQMGYAWKKDHGETCFNLFVNNQLKVFEIPRIASRQNSVISLMLDTSASPNATDSKGRTPIMGILNLYRKEARGELHTPEHVEECGDEAWCRSAIELLLKHGASLDIRDKSGRTAVDYVIRIAECDEQEEIAIEILRCLLANIKPACISEQERTRAEATIGSILVGDESLVIYKEHDD
ncbi:ankyrin repeat-containing domain protein [Podospora aff. communis PSN243]|uniref:Ankyrin repeat-containing domain protein n=1 Tax=Podospora aff. communis PSN243 TaxID=3040156 RepID=A0AAV9GBE2_9PEZI|nr:ankyrin repeat-containing domain protein [Podospora aff. communis PSN243]